jgi:hypothetical protein
MPESKADQVIIKRAIEVYMPIAYDGVAEPPVIVRSMLATLNTFAGEFFKAPTFVKDPPPPATPTKYTLRLGNRYYPHMKLVYELGPDKQTWLLRADSHDAHCCPPQETPEHDAFRQLMTRNQEIVSAIEKAWAAEGLPTFKTFLQVDLAARRSQAAATSATGASSAPTT